MLAAARLLTLDATRLTFQHKVLDEVERRNNYYAATGILHTLDQAIGRACRSTGDNPV
jgi:hypothetical protein